MFEEYSMVLLNVVVAQEVISDCTNTNTLLESHELQSAECQTDLASKAIKSRIFIIRVYIKWTKTSSLFYINIS